MRNRNRFWLVYGIAWLPYAASYTSLFVSHLGRTLPQGIKESIFNVLPAALLGTGVVAICQRLDWSADRRRRFLTVHFVLAIVYVGLWNTVTWFLYAMNQKIVYGSWTYQAATGNAFQRGYFTGVVIYVTIAGIVYAVQTTERLRAQEALAAQAEALRTRAELEALRGQLNPHFLFNTLHSLMALVRHDQQAAEDALETLATLLRHTLMTTAKSDEVALSEELDFVQNYLALEGLRLGDRLRVEKYIQSETLACTVPPFTLQPLVENSIKYAIGITPEGGLLTIRTERHNGQLSLEVTDDGPGADPLEVAASTGSGLKIAKQRLMLHYGGLAHFQLSTRPGQGFSVRIDVPINKIPEIRA